MARNFGVNFSRKRAPSTALRSSLQETPQSSVMPQQYQMTQSGSFDVAVPSGTANIFTQRAQEYANNIAASAGIAPSDIDISQEACEEAYQIIEDWFAYIDTFVPAVATAAANVNAADITAALQENFDQIITPDKRDVIDIVKATANAVGNAANTYGLQTVYSVLSPILETLNLYNGLSPADVIPYIENLVDKLDSFTDSLDDLEATLDSSLVLPTNLSSNEPLPPLAKLVNPSAWAASTGQPVSQSYEFCQVHYIIDALHTAGRPLQLHNALGTKYPFLGWFFIVNAQAPLPPAHAPWYKVQAKAENLLDATDAASGFIKAWSVFRAIGAILDYVAAELGMGVEEDSPWYQILIDIYEWGSAILQAMGGNPAQLAGQLLPLLSQNILDTIVDILEAHETISQELWHFATTGIVNFSIAGTDYTPNETLVAQYLAFRANTLSPSLDALAVAKKAKETGFTAETGKDVVQAIKTLLACCYYNQSAYFWKTGVPVLRIDPLSDDRAYDKWVAWVKEQDQMRVRLEQAVAMRDIVEEGVPTYFRETVVDQVEPIFEQEDVRIDRDDLMFDRDILDRVRQRRTRVRPQRRTKQRRNLGSILPVPTENLYPVVLAGLAYVAYLHLSGKKKLI